MTRALLALLLILGHLPLAAAPRRRAVQHPSPIAAPAAIVTAAREAAGAALKAGVPAVQIAVSYGGQIIYSEAFGVTDTNSKTAATPRSVMQIGSVTKQFTAAAILRLAERGALTLDDRIDKYVPEFDPRGATITIRQILTHTSGLPRTWYVPPPPVSLYSSVPRAQLIQFLNAQPFLFEPGTSWSYSNAGYLLLGYAIESISGMSYADFIRTELALPLGLIDTGVCGTSNLPLPDGYGFLDGSGWVRLSAVNMTVYGGASSLCSTASDLARWSHLLATGYAMLPASYEAMTTPNSVVPNGYAFGVGVQKILGHASVSHDGATIGFQSFLLYFSDEDRAIAVVTNAYPAPGSASAVTIAIAVAKGALSAE